MQPHLRGPRPDAEGGRCLGDGELADEDQPEHGPLALGRVGHGLEGPPGVPLRVDPLLEAGQVVGVEVAPPAHPDRDRPPTRTASRDRRNARRRSAESVLRATPYSHPSSPPGPAR